MTNLEKNELAEVGVQFGGTIRWRNPQMLPYIYKKVNKFNILDLQKIVTSCQEIGNYIRPLIKKKKTILFLSTKKHRDIMKEAAIKCGMPYIANKWKGGFLTNFSEIKKRMEELLGLNKFLARDNFKGLVKNKKQRFGLEKKDKKLQSVYGGVANLHQKPDALFIIGLNKEETAFKEAKKVGIPVIAVCNTNCDPRLVDYVIPGNDENPKSVAFFANLVAEAIIEAKKDKGAEENSIQLSTQPQ